MFCPNCGKQVDDAARFCPECGAAISAPAEEVPHVESEIVPEIPRQAPANPNAKFNGKTTAIISYLTIIGWLVAYYMGDRDEDFAHFHLNQSLILAIIGIIAGVITNIPFIGTIVDLAVFVLWIITFVGCIQGEKKPIPYIGDKFQLLK